MSVAGGGRHFPRAYRIRKRAEYLALQRRGTRHPTRHFVVITRCRDRRPSRLGVTTSKKVGHAPARNRVRRLVREFFRCHREALATPADIVVIARPGAAKLSYEDVKRELARTLGITAP